MRRNNHYPLVMKGINSPPKILSFHWRMQVMMIDTNDLKPLGNTKELIPSIGLGTWKMGGSFRPDHSKDQQWIEAIKYFCERSIQDVGMALIDTAEMYGAGHAEELVGQAVKPFDRERIFIITKVSASNLHKNDVIRSAKKSLKRLQLSYIDLYMIHWPSDSIPLKETMKAMESLVKEGLVHHIGVSNFGVNRLKEARTLLSTTDIVLNQVKYSLLDRSPEHALLPYCQREGITLMAYTPLELGQLVNNRFLNQLGERINKSPAQIALNWLISKERVTVAVKSEKTRHIDDILGTLGWRLPEEMLNEISTYFKRY